MTTYCTVCRNPIPEKRARRNAHFCSESCHAQFRRTRRSERAGSVCRLCGRAFYKKSNLDPVRSAHNISQTEGQAENG